MVADMLLVVRQLMQVCGPKKQFRILPQERRPAIGFHGFWKGGPGIFCPATYFECPCFLQPTTRSLKMLYCEKGSSRNDRPRPRYWGNTTRLSWLGHRQARDVNQCPAAERS
jgi:hypothetical protein